MSRKDPFWWSTLNWIHHILHIRLLGWEDEAISCPPICPRDRECQISKRFHTIPPLQYGHLKIKCSSNSNPPPPNPPVTPSPSNIKYNSAPITTPNTPLLDIIKWVEIRWSNICLEYYSLRCYIYKTIYVY
jgi:hypothetical protein